MSTVASIFFLCSRLRARYLTFYETETKKRAHEHYFHNDCPEHPTCTIATLTVRAVLVQIHRTLLHSHRQKHASTKLYSAVTGSGMAIRDFTREVLNTSVNSIVVQRKMTIQSQGSLYNDICLAFTTYSNV